MARKLLFPKNSNNKVFDVASFLLLIHSHFENKRDHKINEFDHVHEWANQKKLNHREKIRKQVCCDSNNDKKHNWLDWVNKNEGSRVGASNLREGASCRKAGTQNAEFSDGVNY